MRCITLFYSSKSELPESVPMSGALIEDKLYCSLLLPEPLGPSNDSSFSLLLSLADDSLGASDWGRNN